MRFEGGELKFEISDLRFQAVHLLASEPSRKENPAFGKSMEIHPGDFVKKSASFLRAATLVLLAISVSACGNKQTASVNNEGESAPAAHTSGKPVDAATAGSVTGTILFTGAPPKIKAISMVTVPNCAKMHSAPAMTEEFVPGDNGTLQNVVVYLQGDFSAYSFPAASAPVQVEQEGCTYSPHVVAVMTGDPLAVTNKDAVTHNINAMSQVRQGWNETQMRGGEPIVRRFAKEEIPIIVKCNMHPWMRFYLAVVDHPYFQVAGKDGQFALRNVPPGTYTLTAWHETFGVKKQTVVVQPKQEQKVSFTFTDQDHS
jgi:plastocyanin